VKQFPKRHLSRMLDRQPHSWPNMMCGIPRKIEYEPRKRCGIVYMDSGMCTDKDGAIALFTAIDPDVLTIITIAGQNTDTIYRRQPNSEKWEAR